MGNLGMYQVVTTVMKKAGGPLPFLILYALGSYAVLRTGEAGTKKVVRSVKKKMADDKNCKVYTVISDGESNNGVKFKTGDCFKVLEIDGDAVLIELVGDSNNPYVVSAEFLKQISDYKDS